MKRVNKTEKNLQKVWNDLDKAYELLENAITDLISMSNIPDRLRNDIESFDITAITSLKNDVEELIEQIKSK